MEFTNEECVEIWNSLEGHPPSNVSKKLFIKLKQYFDELQLGESQWMITNQKMTICTHSKTFVYLGFDHDKEDEDNKAIRCEKCRIIWSLKGDE